MGLTLEVAASRTVGVAVDLHSEARDGGPQVSPGSGCVGESCGTGAQTSITKTMGNVGT